MRQKRPQTLANNLENLQSSPTKVRGDWVEEEAAGEEVRLRSELSLCFGIFPKVKDEENMKGQQKIIQSLPVSFPLKAESLCPSPTPSHINQRCHSSALKLPTDSVSLGVLNRGARLCSSFFDLLAVLNSGSTLQLDKALGRKKCGVKSPSHTNWNKTSAGGP